MHDLSIEKGIFAQGATLLGAIDEAGRGPLAGPVAAACVVCGPNFNVKDKTLERINDSKKVSAKEREKLYDIIFEKFADIGVGICGHDTIDRINILQATFLAMKKAVGSLKAKPNFIILDGKFNIPNLSIQQKAIIRGDSLSFSIAAASIIAKVSRDRIMRKMHIQYPQYGFDQHKGYGTKLHFKMLEEYGPCAVHRKSFAPIKKMINSRTTLVNA
ncbi:MAG: ribonuclease HII [Patescibacteria group bacterium]|nr:ribonuclease HII [Patescibacteria group bacterium]